MPRNQRPARRTKHEAPSGRPRTQRAPGSEFRPSGDYEPVDALRRKRPSNSPQWAPHNIEVPTTNPHLGIVRSAIPTPLFATTSLNRATTLPVTGTFNSHEVTFSGTAQSSDHDTGTLPRSFTTAHSQDLGLPFGVTEPPQIIITPPTSGRPSRDDPAVPQRPLFPGAPLDKHSVQEYIGFRKVLEAKNDPMSKIFPDLARFGMGTIGLRLYSTQWPSTPLGMATQTTARSVPSGVSAGVPSVNTPQVAKFYFNTGVEWDPAEILFCPPEAERDTYGIETPIRWPPSVDKVKSLLKAIMANIGDPILDDRIADIVSVWQDELPGQPKFRKQLSMRWPTTEQDLRNITQDFLLPQVQNDCSNTSDAESAGTYMEVIEQGYQSLPSAAESAWETMNRMPEFHGSKSSSAESAWTAMNSMPAFHDAQSSPTESAWTTMNRLPAFDGSKSATVRSDLQSGPRYPQPVDYHDVAEQDLAPDCMTGVNGLNTEGAKSRGNLGFVLNPSGDAQLDFRDRHPDAAHHNPFTARGHGKRPDRGNEIAVRGSWGESALGYSPS